MTDRQPWCDPDSWAPFCRLPDRIQINGQLWTVETDGKRMLIEPWRRKGWVRISGAGNAKLVPVALHVFAVADDRQMLTLPRPADPPTCPNCKGHGMLHWYRCKHCNTEGCEACQGSGVEWATLDDPPRKEAAEDETCMECEGDGTMADRIAVHGPGGTVLVGGWFLRELWELGDVRALTATDGPYSPSLVFRAGDRSGLIMGITNTTKFHSAVVLGSAP